MLEIKQGNLFVAGTEALVNPVNCAGVMGKGLALQFKRAFPDNFRQYKAACKNAQVQPGKMLTVKTENSLLPHYIINFPTKRHWRNQSRLDDIQAGIVALVAEIQHLEIESIAIPALGCGHGGLAWSAVKPLIVKAFEEMPAVRVVLFEPGDSSL